MGWDADQYRNINEAFAKAKRALELTSAQADTRAQLQAAARYFATKPSRSPDDCPLFTRYVELARSGGKAYRRELFDLGVSTTWAWIDSTCPSEIPASELEALANELGDQGRLFYVLEKQVVAPWVSDRRAEAAALMSKQFDYAIAGFQRAHRLLRMSDLELIADPNATAPKRWLDRAEREFEIDDFPNLAADLFSNQAIVAFRAGAHAEAMKHMEKALIRLRMGVMPPDQTAMNLLSFAKYLLALNKIRQAVALMEESRNYTLTEPTAIISRSTWLLKGYARVNSAEAFAAGEREVQRITELFTSAPDRAVRRPQTIEAIAEFYESYGRLDLALRASKQMIAAIQDAALRANESARVQTQEQLNVALKDKENAQLRADAELQAERQRGWILAFAMAAAGVAAAGTAMALAMRQSRRLARVSAQLAQRNSELEQRSATRIRLLAAACHDLRQPAHALGMLAELGGTAQQEPARFSAWLQSVRRSTASLSDMLDELMDLGRLDGGHYTPQLGEVPLGELMQEVMLHFGPLAHRKGLTLQAAPVEVHITSDRHLLRRMLFNVVSNAIKYTDRGDVRVGIETVGEQVRLSVQDSGPGIPPDKIDEVFRDYVRLNPTKAAEGLGIGLSIVRRAAELLGHELTLKSAPGHGTCVSLTLPLSTAAPAPTAATEEQSAAADGAVVAVLENDADVRDAMAALLQSWGYRVCAGPEAQAVLASAAEQSLQPHLIITDLHLDNTDGLTEVARLRDGLASPALPALLVTGDLDGTVTGQAALAGVYVAHKPLAPRKLAALVRQLLHAPAELGPTLAPDQAHTPTLPLGA